MATIPVPRSYSQISGAMINALLSKLGLPKLQVGNPALSIIEAAAQSDLRSSQDIFQLLDSQSLDRATGLALDNIGADEDTARIGQTPAVGTLTISDTSFTKISSKIFPGQPAPIVGSATVNVTDASLFPASGAVYLGRGTVNYEGPLSYTSKVNMTNFWVLNLAGGSHTQKYHNLNESVVVAQGGNRAILAGTLVQTPQGNASLAVQFSTQYDALIPDGETIITSVPAVATQEGTIGNVPAGTVNAFVTAPFTGAAVTNDTPFTNGLDNEDDNSYRERIRDVRQSRSRGTPLALTTAVLGITALDENKRVISASVVTRENFPTTLYIDDGTGYEEITGGVAYEVLIDDALGGEQYFQLAQGRPVSKAQDITLLSAPYNLQVSTLSVLVGGVLSAHTFSASDFRAISNASAFEVATSINANSTLLFQAKPTNNGTQVALSAKADTNEDIEVLDTGANAYLGFPAGRIDTLRLYKNDRLLSKDGQVASLVGNPQGLWGAMSSPQTLALTLDGIPLVDGVTPGFITFTDADFVNAGTGFATLSAGDSIAAWAAVFNFRVPGITCTVSADSLVITSNRGRSANASLVIGGGTLVTNKVFSTDGSRGMSQGLNSDYTLDRNLGQIRLDDSEILVVGDRLTAGSLETRAFLQSTALGSVTIAAEATSVSGQTGAELWFDVDGDAQLLKSSLGAGTVLAFSATSESWGFRVRLTASTTVFANAQHGDWIVIQDLGVSQPNRGAYRIASVDPSFFWVEVEQPATWSSSETDTLRTGAVTLVRTSAQLQRVFVQDSTGAATTYTATSFAALINAQLISATAEVFRTNRIRVRTNEFHTGGGTMALVASNDEGFKLGLPVSSAVLNESSHLASQLAANPDTGTPAFQVGTINAVVSPSNEFGLLAASGVNSGSILVGLQPKPDTGPLLRETNNGHVTTIDNMATYLDITVRSPAIENFINSDRLYAASPYSISPQDQLAVVIDGDTASKRFVQNMFRQGGTVGSTYGITMTLTDASQGGVSLAESFGTAMNWQDFAVFMPGRTKSDRVSSLDTTSTVLWRYKRLGPDGNDARIAYGYPLVASEPVLVRTNTFSDQYVDITVLLPSGAARTGTSLRNTSRIGVACTAGPDGNSLYDYQTVFNFLISSASRTQRLDYVAKVGIGWTAGETITGAVSGATAVIQVVGGAPGGANGSLILTAVLGAFINGETITGGGSGSTAQVSGTIYGMTSLLLTLPGAVTNHGLTVGEVIWTQSTDSNFATGAYTIAEVPGTIQVNYRENTNAVAGTPNIGTLSFDNQGEVSAGSSVVVGDIQSIVGGAFAANFQQAIKLTTADPHDTLGKSPVVGSVTGTLTWYLSGLNVSFFPLNTGASGIVAIAAAVNALTNSPVTAVAVGNGVSNSGVISDATYEAAVLGGANPWWYFSDGLNWVRSTNTPTLPANNFVFTLKDSVTAALATNSDWANERVFLVPITALNVVDFLSTPGPGGLFASAEVEVAAQGRHPQIASLTPGSVGSVQVQGGAANFLSAAVQGSAVDVASTYAVVSVDASDGASIYAQNWVRLQNAIAVPKANIDANTTLTSITLSTGVVVYNGAGTKAWTFANAGGAPIAGVTWQIEKQGRFVAFVYVAGSSPNLSGVSEGDWVNVSDTLSGPGIVSSVNQGFFRIVRIDNTAKTFWVENPNVLEETQIADLAFLTYDSIVPKDLLVINTPIWGRANIGTWVVRSIDLATINPGFGNNQWQYTLESVGANQSAVAALGANAPLIQVVEKLPSSLIKQILAVSPNQANPALVDVKFTTDAGFTKVTEAAGTLLLSLDKLGFPSSTATGIDGYRHSLGLIQEANKVSYGLESDPTTYPGIVAAGANVNIEGPLVRRVQVSLALRVQSGINSTDIINQVQSAVASTVNQTGVGLPVAISAIVDAAMSVNGVNAVTVLSPTYGPGNDLISVQPFEKALVLNLADDVLVSFVGT
jgi:uncharacterized phage protein gp47/JayE